MNLSNIKLSSATFDYYTLCIDSKCDPLEVKTKFATLKKFDANAKYIVLDIVEYANEEVFVSLIKQLDDVARETNLEIKFVKASALVVSKEFAGKPVYDIPVTHKSASAIKDKTMMLELPVRSGTLVKNDGDIIVLSLISHGAQVISSGNIHVYGECRGRLVAGANGDKKARIFVNEFNAEYIAIAGVYKVIEDKLPANLFKKRVQIFLDEKERLNVVPY